MKAAPQPIDPTERRTRLIAALLKIVVFASAVFLFQQSHVSRYVPFAWAMLGGGLVGFFRHLRHSIPDRSTIRALALMRRSERVYPALDVVLINAIQRMAELLIFVLICRAFEAADLIAAFSLIILVDFAADIAHAILIAVYAPDPPVNEADREESAGSA